MDIDWCAICDNETSGGIYCSYECFAKELEMSKLSSLGNSGNCSSILYKAKNTGYDFAAIDNDLNTLHSHSHSQHRSENGGRFSGNSCSISKSISTNSNLFRMGNDLGSDASAYSNNYKYNHNNNMNNSTNSNTTNYGINRSKIAARRKTESMPPARFKRKGDSDILNFHDYNAIRPNPNSYKLKQAMGTDIEIGIGHSAYQKFPVSQSSVYLDKFGSSDRNDIGNGAGAGMGAGIRVDGSGLMAANISSKSYPSLRNAKILANLNCNGEFDANQILFCDSSFKQFKVQRLPIDLPLAKPLALPSFIIDETPKKIPRKWNP